jgi:outer membrane biosynthesis protein TonB
MSAFSWRCQYCSWAFQMSPEAVAAALAVADATQARHHVEHCPRCRKALKIPVDQLRHHAPINAPAASPAPISNLLFKEDKKTMNQTPAPFPPIEPVTPVPPTPAPIVLPPPAPAVKKPVVRKPAKKVVRKAVKKTVKKAPKKAAKKSAKKAAKKTTKKKGKR